jgi:hypothetical protein
MKKSTKIIIIISVSAVALLCLLPVLIFGVVFGSLWHFNASKPDLSDDPLIPAGYVETDGNQGYGAGDWVLFSYFVYSEMPELDECFQVVTSDNQEPIEHLFNGFSSDNDDSAPLLNSKNLAGRISDGDYFYIESIRDRKTGGCIYYYDIQENALFFLDYAW